MVDSFSTQKVPELSNNLNFTGLDKIYFNFNKNIDQIYQLMENDSFIDFPDQVKMKIEQNILLAKKCLSLIKKEKNLNLYEEAMILEKNIGKYTIKVLENYQRAQNLPQSTEYQLRTVEQINLIGEQINLIYQNIIEAIQNDLAKDITINQQLIKKTNHLTVK